MMSEESPKPQSPQEEVWARDILKTVALTAITEQRRGRRWGIFFKLLFFAYVGVALALVHWPKELEKNKSTEKHTALIRIEGVIASGAEEVNAKTVIEALRRAAKERNVAGIVIEINSPGGSPVQSGEIFDEIQKIRQQNPKLHIYAVTGDVCASGGYYIAAAAEKIFTNKSSIVGSIGVRMDSFGFTEAMEKLGVQRRAYTAGSNKNFLDPFKPEKPSDVEHLQQMLDNIHQQFIAAVKQGRGGRLKDHPDLFSGLMWTGEQGIELGLVDELGSIRSVAEEVIKEKNIVDYTKRTRWVDRLIDGAETELHAVLMRMLGRGWVWD